MWTFDQDSTIKKLTAFFQSNGGTARDFGNRIYQTFEAITFAQVIKWYQDEGWTCEVVNPGAGHKSDFRLKFSTRGNAKNFTFVRCRKECDVANSVQIRHQIRVEIFHNIKTRKTVNKANIVCDVAILKDESYDHIVGNMHVSNDKLISFAEAKHMDAYAELIASFVGIVHELQPWRMINDRKKLRSLYQDHPKPFLNISGISHLTASAIKETFKKRNYDFEIFDAHKSFTKI